jgi:CubicO group peptidase (beta-lactamase class C family)
MARLLTLILVCLTVASPAFAQDVARMEDIIQGYVQKRTFMGSVLVARDGDLLLNKAYGMANVESVEVGARTARWQAPVRIVLAKMLTPEKNNYAYGVLVRTVNSRKQIWHNGGINGFNSSMAYYPDSKLTIVVLANLNGPVADQLLAQLGVRWRTAICHATSEIVAISHRPLEKMSSV